jgi:hypothetical protein
MIQQWTLSIFRESFGLLAVIAQRDFYLIIGFLVFIGVSLIVWIVQAQVKKKNALTRKEKQMPEIATKFGKAVSVSADALCFEHNETIFEAEIKSEEINLDSSNMTSTEFEVKFSLPNLREKFFIQYKSAFSNYPADCEPLLLSAMPADLIFHSLNSQFLLSLLEKKKILIELDKYPNIYWGNQFRISFENCVFTISWKFLNLKEQTKAEKLEQICQTAVVFYDELTKK